MTDAQEAAFLRALADNPADDATRAVYADWLEENGDAARAEFVRVGPGVRERELLEAHRAAWIDAVGVSLEDVRFEGGVIVAARLPLTDKAFLSPDVAARLATLRELDLSGCGLIDADLAAFAARADLPALRKLMLNDNALTDAGAVALAAAKGLPRLEVVYLFGNAVGAAGQAALQKADGFRLTTLDLGEAEEGYSLSPGRADAGRRRQVREEVLPLVRKTFDAYPRLKTAALCVAQYWADEADDAVHGMLIVSELPEPLLSGASYDGDEPDPNIPNSPIKAEYGGGHSSVVSMYESVRWDDNADAIPLWAAFSTENGTQEDDIATAYSIAVLFHRHGGYEFREPARPYLDGVRAEYDDEM